MGEVIKVILYCAILGMLVYIFIMWRANVLERKQLRGKNYVETKPFVSDKEQKDKDKKLRWKVFLVAGLLGIFGLAVFMHLKNKRK